MGGDGRHVGPCREFAAKTLNLVAGWATLPVPWRAMNSIGAPSFQWSELGRRSGEVGAAVDTYGEVTVVRGSQTLRLSARPSIESTGVLGDLCRLLSALTEVDEPDHVSLVLATAWPWTRALPEDARLAFAAEVGPVMEMCESLGSYNALTNLLNDWRRTARALADGERPAVIDEPLGTAASKP